MNDVAFHNLILTKYFFAVKSKGSSSLSPAHGKSVARATIKNVSAPPPEKIAGGFQQAGKKEGGMGEGIFARLLTAPKARLGWEAACPCVSKEAKPAKIDSLIERIFCACPLKNVSIFAGFVRRQAASRRAGLPPCGRQLVGVFPKVSSNFFQNTPPKTISRLARRFAPRFGGQFGKIIPRLFERNGKRARRKAAVHKRSLYCGFAARTDGFSFAFGESQNEILLNCRCKALPFSKIKNF